MSREKAGLWAAAGTTGVPEKPRTVENAKVFWCTLSDLYFADAATFGEKVEGKTIAAVWRGRVYVGSLRSDRERGCMFCLARSVLNREVPGIATQIGRVHHFRDENIPADGSFASAQVQFMLRDLPEESGHPIVIDAKTFAVSPLTIVPRDGCAICGHSSTRTVPVYGSGEHLLRKAGHTLRGGVERQYEELSAYVEAGGILLRASVDLDSPLGAVEARVPLQDGRSEPGLGRATSFDASRMIAIYEALERHAGINSGGTRDIFRATFDSLGDEALDPRSLGVHSPEDYAQVGFGYTPFAPDTPVSWVRAIDLSSPDRYVVVPERAAYWGSLQSQDPRTFYDSSNGTALGSTAEEASLHALLELVERDAFMLTWYLRLELPEIHVNRDNRELWSLIQRCELFSGFRIRLLYAAMESEIPVVIAYAENLMPSGPRRFVSAGASLDTTAAAVSAVKEVIGILLATQATWPAQRERGRNLPREPERVIDMMDHSLIGSMPETAPWFDFLDSRGDGVLELHSLPVFLPERMSIKEDLEYVVNQLSAAYLSPHIVDMTTAELRWKGLSCVRALVPGLLPMTFGHSYRRTTGLTRLDSRNLPYRSLLGDRSPLDTPPHPFP